jgi:hypothetical protein
MKKTTQLMEYKLSSFEYVHYNRMLTNLRFVLTLDFCPFHFD